MDSKPMNLNDYVREQLKHRNFKVIAYEARRNGAEGLALRADLHSSEAVREQRLLSLTSKTNKFCCIAIDPDSGLFGAYQIFQPNGELPFEGLNAEALPSSAEATAIAASEAVRLRKAGSAATAIANGIVAAEIKDYETLIEKIPKDADPNLTLQHLKLAKGKLMEIETTEGSFSSGGYEQLKDSLPCRQLYKIVADISTTDEGNKQDPRITFVPSQNQPDGCMLPPMFKNQVSIQADITTSNKRAALKFIHFSLYQDLDVELELELEYAITTGRWSVKVVNILGSKEIIKNAKSAQLVFEDW